MRKSEIIKLIKLIENQLDIDFLINKLRYDEKIIKFKQITPYIFDKKFSQN